MSTLLTKLDSTLPWLRAESGPLGDKKFRKQHGLPPTSLNLLPSPNRVIAVYQESSLNWTVMTFTTNMQLTYLNFSKRLTKPRAEFAVLEFVLEEVVECLSENLESQQQNFPDDSDGIQGMMARLAAAKQILSQEQNKPIEPTTFHM